MLTPIVGRSSCVGSPVGARALTAAPERTGTAVGRGSSWVVVVVVVVVVGAVVVVVLLVVVVADGRTSIEAGRASGATARADGAPAVVDRAVTRTAGATQRLRRVMSVGRRADGDGSG